MRVISHITIAAFAISIGTVSLVTLTAVAHFERRVVAAAIGGTH
jgi:hypothetical protein